MSPIVSSGWRTFVRMISITSRFGSPDDFRFLVDPLSVTMILFVTNGHMLVIGGLLSTFRFLPVGAKPDTSHGTDVLLSAFHVFFVTAVQIALPMIAVLFLADLGLALLTKVAPQLNAINVMFPAKIGLTLLLVGLSFPVLPQAMDKMVDLS